MEPKEDIQLNRPASNYFKRKLKCIFSRVGFTFSAGELDVLAYDSRNKCFHICEGKRSSNVASIGHAIGQLIGYISMIQENGYDFLDRVSQEERLELSDFSIFLEKRAIKVYCYIVLPENKKDRLIVPAKLMLKTIGDFGESIGIFFASKNKCTLEIVPKSINVRIRRIYNREEFLEEISDRFMDSPESNGLMVHPTNYPYLVQIKRKSVTPYLHFEVCFKKKLISDVNRKIEIAFHVEFAKAHLKDKAGIKRKSKILRLVSSAKNDLKMQGLNFKFQRKWGKNWARLYIIYETIGVELDEISLNDVSRSFTVLVKYLKPRLDQINWGRGREREVDTEE